MRSLLTPVAAGVLTAAVVITPLLPASAAAGHAHAASSHAKPGKPVPSNPADKRLAAEKRAVASQVATKDAALARAVRNVTRAGLAVGAEDVLANLAADRLALAGLAAEAAAATTVTDVRLVGDQVRAVRPETYSVVVNGLRQAAAFETRVADNADALAALGAAADIAELDGADVTAVRDLLATATLANDEAATQAAAALGTGVLLTAFSTQEERAAFSAAVAAAGDALDVVETQLALAETALAGLPTVVQPTV